MLKWASCMDESTWIIDTSTQILQKGLLSKVRCQLVLFGNASEVQVHFKKDICAGKAIRLHSINKGILHNATGKNYIMLTIYTSQLCLGHC